MTIPTADFTSGAQSAGKREQLRRQRDRGDIHDRGGRKCVTIFAAHQSCGRGMCANHHVDGDFPSRLDQFDQPLTELLRQERGRVEVEELVSKGEFFLWLYVEEILTWVIAAPGSSLHQSHLELWCWRLQHYDSSSECLLTLTDIEELAPAKADASLAAHARALQGLKRLQVDEVGNLEVLITELEEELQAAMAAARADRDTGRKRRWIPRMVGYRPVVVTWPTTPGLAAGGEKDLTVGEEHGGRFRVAFGAGEKAAEAEVDLKRSMVTLHPLANQPPLLVAGKALNPKVSLPVSDVAMGENPPELRFGMQLGDELERVVCIG